ncbi:HNH endonuclease [Geobacillus stearothermophilus]|uniref:HNH endonuclease n=1 Tax=Geobacillus stearothermophilus TaxID=1422 RepID=UPI003D25F22F
MNLSHEFHPAPKPAKARKDKPKPLVREKKPKKRKKKLEVYKGRTIPSKKTRGKISKKDYMKAIEVYGPYCAECGSPYIEMHHVKPKGLSAGGRGVWRNLVPLCPEHHRGKTGVHQSKELMEKYQRRHEALYGQYYYCDKYDLFKLGLIPTPTDECYERFMREEERRAQMVRDRPHRENSGRGEVGGC